jgi:DNA-binding GntR family transcriptional regulator
MVNSCMEEIGRLLHIGLATEDYGEKYQHEHRELIQALVDGDEDAAESLTYTAIRGGEEMVLRGLLEGSTLVDVPAPRTSRLPSS